MYSKLMKMCMEMPLSEACARIGISRSKLYSQRSIVERLLVDRDEHMLIVTANEANPITKLNKLCRDRPQKAL